jgi:hypothetical protein
VLKKLVAAGAIAAALGGVVLGAVPAQADDFNNWAAGNNGAGNFQVLPIQTCRGIDAAGIGAAVHTILGVSNEQGPCVNGPVTAQGR